MWLKSGFYGVGVGMFASFAVTRTIDDDSSSKILIVVDVFAGICAFLELFQMRSNFFYYIREIWNYLDILLIGATITISVLFWSEGNADALNFFVSLASVLYFTKLLLVLRIVDAMRTLIRMILEVIKDMIAFMIVIIVCMVAFSIGFFQWRRAIRDDSIDEGSFGGDLMEMFILIFTGGNPDDYSGIAIPFYVLVTVLQCLILLNLIIAIMGDTFSRIKKNSNMTDSKERINMLLEVAEEARHVSKFMKNHRQPCEKAYFERKNSFD